MKLNQTMNQSKKKHILVGDIGNTETKIFFRNNKIKKKNYYKKQRNDL